MKMKSFWSLGLAAMLMVSSAVSCFAADTSAGLKGANEDAPNTETSDETLTVALSSEPSGLWGAGTGKLETEMEVISSALLDTLITVDRATGEIRPNLATEWEWVDDTHCRFTLRDDVTMTDGTPLVADDVVYSVNVWKEYSANTDTGRYLSDVSSEDEHTVTIGFNTVAPDLLYMLAWANFGIVSEDEVNAIGGLEEADKNPSFGSGKYRFKEWNRGQYVTMERNDNYWNPDYKGYFKEIRIIFTSDASARIMAVQSGDTQVTVDIPLAMAAAFAGNDAVNVITYEYGQNNLLWYNMGSNAGATADLKVRQAIDKALNFEAIAQVNTGGFGKEARGYLPEVGKFYHEMYTDEERAQDIEGAKALLEEAGYGDGLSLSILGVGYQEPAFTVIQENLRQAGIDLEINLVDVPRFVEDSNAGNYDLCMVGDYADARYPTIFGSFRQENIDTFYIGGAKWTTPELEEAITAFIQEPDEEKAQEDALKLETMLKENMPFSVTDPDMKASLTASDIKGYTTIERGDLDITNFYR